MENKHLELEVQKNKKLLDEANASRVKDSKNLKMFKKVEIFQRFRLYVIHLFYVFIYSFIYSLLISLVLFSRFF